MALFPAFFSKPEELIWCTEELDLNTNTAKLLYVPLSKIICANCSIQYTFHGKIVIFIHEGSRY